MLGCASSAMAMHSSSVRVRPAMGARSVAGAACARAHSAETKTTRKNARETLRRGTLIWALRISRRWTGRGWPVYTFSLDDLEMLGARVAVTTRYRRSAIFRHD